MRGARERVKEVEVEVEVVQGGLLKVREGAGRSHQRRYPEECPPCSPAVGRGVHVIEVVAVFVIVGSMELLCPGVVGRRALGLNSWRVRSGLGGGWRVVGRRSGVPTLLFGTVRAQTQILHPPPQHHTHRVLLHHSANLLHLCALPLRQREHSIRPRSPSQLTEKRENSGHVGCPLDFHNDDGRIRHR